MIRSRPAPNRDPTLVDAFGTDFRVVRRSPADADGWLAVRQPGSGCGDGESDRHLMLSGYELYCFGAVELSGDTGTEMLESSSRGFPCGMGSRSSPERQ